MVPLPSMRQQPDQVFFGSFVEVWHGGNDGVEVKPGIYVMVAAGCQQRLDDAHVFDGLVVAAEHVVLASERDWPDFVLGEVVVQEQLSVVEYAHHIVPAGVGVGDGLSGQGAFAVPQSLGLHPFLHLRHDRP